MEDVEVENEDGKDISWNLSCQIFLKPSDNCPLFSIFWFKLKCRFPWLLDYIFRIYCSGSHGPVLLLLHGGGHSALSWAVFTVSIITIKLVISLLFNIYTPKYQGIFTDVFRYDLNGSYLDLCSLLYTAGSTAGWWLWTSELMVNTNYSTLMKKLLLCYHNFRCSYGHSTQNDVPWNSPQPNSSPCILWSCSLTTGFSCSIFELFFSFLTCRWHQSKEPRWSLSWHHGQVSW